MNLVIPSFHTFDIYADLINPKNPDSTSLDSSTVFKLISSEEKHIQWLFQSANTTAWTIKLSRNQIIDAVSFQHL